jgi:hypothetical protein
MQRLGLLSRSATAGNDANQTQTPLPANAPDAGYVYLSISPVMPGFVQIAASKDDPQGLKWSLQTPSGVTRFHSICSSKSTNCGRLVAQFQQAVKSNQIPHHPELFQLPVRFARQILEDEAKAFAPIEQAPASPPKRRGYFVAIAAAASLAAVLLLHPLHHQTTAKLTPAYRHSLPQLRM